MSQNFYVLVFNMGGSELSPHPHYAMFSPLGGFELSPIAHDDMFSPLGGSELSPTLHLLKLFSRAKRSPEAKNVHEDVDVLLPPPNHVGLWMGRRREVLKKGRGREVREARAKR